MPAESLVIEMEIVEQIRAAKIRLRFDKVVLRLVSRLQAALTGSVPHGEAVIFTVTAPIKHPAKTAEVIEALARDSRPNAENCQTVHGNQVRIRRLTAVPPRMPKVLGFVHDPASDARLILALAETRLLAGDAS